MRRQPILAGGELEVVVVVGEAEAARLQALADTVQPIGQALPGAVSGARLFVHPGTDQGAAAELAPELDRPIEPLLERLEIDVRRGHDQAERVERSTDHRGLQAEQAPEALHRRVAHLAHGAQRRQEIVAAGVAHGVELDADQG